MKLYIRNMVSLRCKIMVREELAKIGYTCKEVDLGRVETEGNMSRGELLRFKERLLSCGLELMEKKDQEYVRQIKNIIIHFVNSSTEPMMLNLSHFLSQRLDCDYSYLSHLFSRTERISIERFYITQKLEVAKELYLYKGFSLTEIADRLHYSSVAHLSSQFKRFMGLSPSSFKIRYAEGLAA